MTKAQEAADLVARVTVLADELRANGEPVAMQREVHEDYEPKRRDYLTAAASALITDDRWLWTIHGENDDAAVVILGWEGPEDAPNPA